MFAGTTEGRILGEWLASEGVETLCCVATEYGKELMKPKPGLEVLEGRLPREEMRRLFEQEERPLVVDATHPYASLVSENIHGACEEAGCRYLRLIRPSAAAGVEGNVIKVGSVDEAVSWLSGRKGRILVTTGSKELSKFTALPDFQERVFARVLPSTEAVCQCTELGFPGKNLICMQGPFSKDMNLAMLRHTEAEYLVTKESGRAGGFPEKLAAAKEAGVRVLLIGRPPEQEGMSVEEGAAVLMKEFSLEGRPKFSAGDEGKAAPEKRKETVQRKAYLVGIGMGVPENMTGDAAAAFREADCILGSGRMLDPFRSFGCPLFDAYDPGKMAEYVNGHPEYRKIAVALSGDVGFYSGAKRLMDVFEAEGIQTELIPGISSAAYFCSRLKIAWEDVKLMSVHGRSQNLVAAVKRHFRTFTLLGGKDCVQTLCEKLLEYGLGEVTLYIGERLHYPQEKITEGRPEELIKRQFDGLCVALIENPGFQKMIPGCIPDEEFIRGGAPMTKCEIRGLSVDKLGLSEDAVVWDIGAGTGSVTVEMALQAFEGQVWAVEKNPEAARLIGQNCRKFGTVNVQVIEGTAPEALRDLPAPTHVFIGGSSGNLWEILKLCLEKNPSVRVVLNAITLETVSEANRCLKELPFTETEIVQIQAAKAKKAGPYQMMMGQNPVYIFSARGQGGEIG